MTFAKIFRTVTQHLCVAASGASTILVMVKKTLRIDFLYYVYFTGMTIELKLRSSATRQREKEACTKSIVFKKGLYERNFLIFHDIMDVVVLFSLNYSKS